MLQKIADGRTDLVFEYVAAGHPADSKDETGVSLIAHCAYFGDVSAVRFLLGHGESLESLGPDLGLSGACFHGHWRLCQFLLEHGADASVADPVTGETPLHHAICRTGDRSTGRLVRVLLSAGADPNARTFPGAETGDFMRDCRTRGETPLHRAAAYADEETIAALIAAGADREARDANGDTPLTWASWQLRPTPILRRLCHGEFRVHPERTSMADYLAGKPHE